MRRREILHVDIVANAGSVARRIVLAVDDELVPAAERDVEDERDEVRLGPVILAVALPGARGVEVAERERPEPPCGGAVGEQPFDRELRVAVRVERAQRRLLPDRGLVRLPVHGGGRGEEKVPHPRLPSSRREAKRRRRCCSDST